MKLSAQLSMERECFWRDGAMLSVQMGMELECVWDGSEAINTIKYRTRLRLEDEMKLSTLFGKKPKCLWRKGAKLSTQMGMEP